MLGKREMPETGPGQCCSFAFLFAAFKKEIYCVLAIVQFTEFVMSAEQFIRSSRSTGTSVLGPFEEGTETRIKSEVQRRAAVKTVHPPKPEEHQNRYV
jgi:hypothetical protein